MKNSAIILIFSSTISLFACNLSEGKKDSTSKALPIITKESEPSPEITLFTETVLEIIGLTVEKFEFIKHRTKIEEYSTTIIFRKNKQYIKISGSNYPTDYPYSYNIILGEGDSEDFLEWDWNSIKLWQIKNKIKHNTNSKEYEFPTVDNVKLNVSHANKEIMTFAEPFLNGDLTLFYETRSEVNKEREPYKIYTPDSTGKYVITNDEKSSEQKKKLN